MHSHKRKRPPREQHRRKELCTHGRKTAYDTERIARVAGARMGKAIQARMRAYKCDHCHLWHLTHADPAERSKPRELRNLNALP
jgi:hypothetical protein